MSNSELAREEAVKLWFNNIHRLEVFAAVFKYSVNPPQRFTQKEIQENLLGQHDVPVGEAGRQIRALERLGMVEKRCAYGGVSFTRTDSPYWNIVDAAVRAFDEEFPVDTGS